jgi:hypothetical protein
MVAKWRGGGNPMQLYIKIGLTEKHVPESGHLQLNMHIQKKALPAHTNTP